MIPQHDSGPLAYPFMADEMQEMHDRLAALARLDLGLAGQHVTALLQLVERTEANIRRIHAETVAATARWEAERTGGAEVVSLAARRRRR